MNENAVNTPLLRKAVEWAEAEATKPRELREWEQGYFVLPATDDDPQIEGHSWRPSLFRRGLLKAPECGTCYCVAGFVDSVASESPSHYDAIQDVAADHLGLTESQSHDLFNASNTIEDVRRIAEHIVGERL